MNSLRYLAAPACLALLVLLASLPVHAAATGDLQFERIGKESGPPPVVITALYQDRAGFLWIGSRDGLFLFDGYTFTTFSHDASDATSISDNAIRTIYEDGQGDLWIGTNTGGLNRMNRATWEFEQFRHDSADPRTLSHDSVYAIAEDAGGTLWVGTQVGLNRFDRATGTFQRHMASPGRAGSLSHDYVFALYRDRQGRMWVGTVGGGLNLWDPDSGTFTAFRHDPGDPSSLNDDIVFAIAEGSAGSLWVGTNTGLNRMDRAAGTFRRFLHDPEDPSSLGYHLVTSLAPGPPGKLWVGTHSGGLNQLDLETETFRAWRHEPGRGGSLGSDQVISLLTDNAGTLWIGTWGGGLNRLTTSSLLLSSLAGLARMPGECDSINVTALAHDDAGGIWFGTRSGDLIRRDPALRSDRFHLRGGSRGTARIILQLLEDRDGRIWIGTNGGLLRLDPNSGDLADYYHDPGDPGSIGPGYVKAILPDGEGRLWVGTGEGGLNLVDDGGRVLSRFVNDPADSESLGDNYITALFEDHGGTLWVGTRSGGLNTLDPESGRAVRYQPDPADERSISHHYVTSIVEDSTGRLWVGTGGGGLNRVDRLEDGEVLRFTRFTERDGLIDNDVMTILEGEDGSLWLSTKRGLSRFDPRSGIFTSLYVSDGLPSGEFEPGAAARVGSTLYFGSVKGVVAIPGEAPFPEPSPSPTVVTEIRTASGRLFGDRPVWDLDELEVPYGTWLSLQFVVMDYSTEHMHRYAYNLGDGEDWVDLGARREITFTDLDPKVHELRVRGRNSQGVWTDAEPALRIRVIPPFWMTFWFRGLVLLGIIALTIGWHQARMSALEKRNKELWELTEQREKARKELRDAYERLRGLTRRLEEAKEDERKRIARELHDDMGPSLTAVIINLQLLSDDSDAEKTARRRTDTIDLVDRMIERIRDLSLDLRPPLIDELGLVPALSGYLEGQAERAGIAIELSEDSAAEGLPPEIEITAFRVVQEAVTNVIRHSRAKRAGVVVRTREGRLELIVSDDGRGFDVGDTMERASRGKALGLLGMQERVGMLGGAVAIESSPGKGTVIRASMPVEVQP